MKRTLFNPSSVRLITLLCFVLCFFGMAAFAHAEGNPLDFAGEWLAKLVYSVSLMIGGLFVGIGGLALDLSIQYLIIGMGGFFTGIFGQGVIEMWKVVRDLLNIFFIFGFIYIGIRTILDADESSTRKALGYLILAALFINFSLYITGAIIDFSNIAATQVYKLILDGPAGAEPIQVNMALIDAEGIGGKFVNVASLTSFFAAKDVGLDDSSSINVFQTIAYSIFMLIFFIFAGFIFLIAAIRVMIRFVALTLYMIFSPVMFLGWILPKFSEYSTKWRDGLISNSFYAPIFLFLIYISLYLLTELKKILFQDAPADYAAVFKGGQVQGKEFLIFIFFGMMLAFIYASMRVGDTLSVAGAKASRKFVGGLQGNIYRNTVGRGIHKIGLGTYDRLDKAAADGHVGARITRNLIGGEPTRHAIERAANYGAGGKGLEDAEKEEKGRKARLREAAEKDALKKAAKELKSSIQTGTAAGADDNARIKLESSLNDASTADLVKLAGDKEGEELLKKVVGSLSEKKFDGLMDSKDLSPEYKNGLGKARAESVATLLRTSGTLASGAPQTEEQKLQEGLKSATADQLNAIDFEMLSNPDNIIYTQSGQLDKLESKWGDEKMRLFKKKRTEAIEAVFPTDPGLIIKSRKGDKEIAKLPTSVFKGTNRDILLDELSASGKLTGGLMQSIAADSGLSGTDKKDFGAAVRKRFYNTSTSSYDYSTVKDVEKFLDSAAGAAFGGSR
jgi:hypothetical protein